LKSCSRDEWELSTGASQQTQATAVDFGAKNGHDFDQVGTNCSMGFCCDFTEYGDFDAAELADLEDDFTSEAEQEVFVG